MNSGPSYIVLDNYGLPRFADEECEKLHVFATKDAAFEFASQEAIDNPNVIYTIFKRTVGLMHDGVYFRKIDDEEAE
jgi:hypothetical protein